MFRSLNGIIGRRGSKKIASESGSKQLRNAARKAANSVVMEALESRRMMSVVYHPVFGVETQKQDNGATLSSPPVELIFWGSYWNGTNSPQAQAIENAAANVLNSSYLHLTSQYGTDGKASLSQFAYDSSNPSNGHFNDGDISNVIENQIDNGPLPESDTPAHTPIYVVVTPPGVRSDSARAVGFNYLDHDTDIGFFYVDYDDIPGVWSWSGNNSDGTVNVDQFSLTFSHEIGEIMTDLGGGGFKINAGSSWVNGGDDQIGDNEGNSYSFREPNGADVQPLWSRNDQAFVADNGTDQNVDLYPVWNSPTSFSGKYDLVVNGDQKSNHNDFISLGKTAAGGVRVFLNGETTTFDPGMIRNVTVNTGDGQDLVIVQDTVVPTTINSNSPQNGPDDTIIIGDGGNTQGITSKLTINNPSGYDNIDISDSTDPFGRNVTVGNAAQSGFGAVTGIAPVEIDFPYGDTRGLTVETGTSGFDTVNVVATGVPTTVVGHGNNTVNAGTNGSVQGIGQKLTVENIGGGTTLNVDDGFDTAARTVTLNDASASGFGSITGLGAAEIDYNYSQTSKLNLTLGVGGNTVNVDATGSNTELLGGTGLSPLPILHLSAAKVIPIPIPIRFHGGPNTVNVGSGGGVQNIRAGLAIENVDGLNTINVDDGTDATARNVTLDTVTPSNDPVAFGTITGLAPATISYEYTDTSSVGVTLGVGGNTVNVHATGVPTNLTGGSVPLILHLAASKIVPIPFPLPRLGGPDTVNVGNGAVQSINGPLTIDNAYGQDTINLDDGTDGTGRNVTLDTVTPSSDPVPFGTITGLAPASINYEYSDTKSIGIILGVGGNTVNVHATGAPTTLLGGSVPLILHLSASKFIPFPLPRLGGPDTINVGNAGNAQSVASALTIENSYGRDTITVDDSADTSGRSVTLGAAPPNGDNEPFGTVSGLTPGVITYEAADTASLTLDGGAGLNAFNVTGTPTNQLGGSGGPGITLNAGPGDDTVSVTGQGAGTTLTVNGQAGTDALSLTGANAADAFSLSAAQVVHGTATINFATTERLGLSTGTFNAASDLGGLSVTATGADATVNFGTSQHLAALYLFGAKAALATGGNSIDATDLAITGGGKLDLADGSLLLHYGGFDPLSSVRSYLTSGYAGGAWNGVGIDTSKADANHGLGYADSADGVVAGLAANTVLVKYTTYGDANLDGKVDFNDLLIESQNTPKNLVNATWDQGDFNYDGKVNFADLLLLSQNFGH